MVLRRTQGGEPMTCILVVDDDAWARGGVKDLLESYGYQVAEAQSGAEALEQLKTVDAAMMLSDVNMDEMSGMELVLRVRTIRPGFKFIMYTALYKYSSSIETWCQEAGIALLPKPVNADALIGLIYTLVGEPTPQKPPL
jgi:DNA-binding NtrC family response regulator